MEKGKRLSNNIWFDMILDKMATISDSKRHDYASEDDPFLNFLQVGDIAGLTTDQVFMVWVTTKVVRLGQLVGGDKEPNNESIDDSIIDLANYAALWAALRLRESEEHQPPIGPPPIWPTYDGEASQTIKDAWDALTEADPFTTYFSKTEPHYFPGAGA